MFRPYELFIGLRYTRAKRRNHFISFISLISMLGIALGVTVLITVLSVMNGFEQELRNRILGVVSHVTISGITGTVDNWQRLAEVSSKHADVVAAAPYIDGEGMMTFGSEVAGTLLRGIVPEAEKAVSNVEDNMLVGSLSDLRPGEFGMVIGRQLANQHGIMPGDKVTLIIPQANVTPTGILPRMKRFTIVGIFDVGMYEYDSALALIHLDDAARLFRLPGEASGVRLKVKDMFLAPKVTQALVEDLPPGYIVSDWTRQHVSFFRAVRTEKTVMFVILLLIVAVAVFNIVSTLVMTVRDKEADIAILRTLGATPRSIMTVFMIQGTVIGLVGTVLGVIGGVALALNVETVVPVLETLLHIQFLPADVYQITDLPSDLHINDVVTVCTISFLFSIVATLYPAWRASRTQPAEALRYE